MGKYCIKCGKKLNEKEKFCTKCGTSVDGLKPVITKSEEKSIRKSDVQWAGFFVSIIGLLTCGVLSILGLITSIVEIKEGKKQNKKYGLAIVGAVISSIMMIILVVYTIFVIVTAKDVIVVDFSGMSYEEAEQFCKDSELSCSVYEEFSDSIPKGDYIRQTREAEKTIKSYLSVAVYYSKGVKPSKNKTDRKVKDESNDSDNHDNSSDYDNSSIYDNLSIIKDKKLLDNFVKACDEIKINVSDINNMKKAEDWNSGPRYTFSYKDDVFILYALDNGEVSSITIANNKLDKIYLDGYESVNVNDFLVSESMRATLIVLTEEKIESYLNDPSSANFQQLGFGFARRYDIYQITGSFTAKNSFNSKVESKFLIEFKVVDGVSTVVYLNVDGKNYIGSKSNMKEIARKEKKTDLPQTNDNSIILKDGILGEYGKKDKFDGEEYIRYYIPAGTYKVEALTKNAMFYIETIKIHKEDGFDTSTFIRTVKLEKVGDKETITIKSDQCLSLVVHTQIKLIKE